MNSRIVIVGGGAAGVACGMKLMKNGFKNVTILEAEDRIGGRIHSIPFNNVMVDEGAQWCHGEEDNIVFETVKNLNLLAPSKCDYTEFECYNSKGESINRSLTDKLHKLSNKISSDYETMSETKNTPLQDYFIATYNREIKDLLDPNDEKALAVAKQFIDMFHKFTLVLSSAFSWNDISTCSTTAYRACEGNQYLNWKDKGYAAFLDVLMERIDGSSILDEKIIKQKKVTNIKWEGNKEVEILCYGDNNLLVADHVIVTTSIGVLKENHKTLFTPSLPLNKINAIESVGYGVANKIQIKFPYRWWKSDDKAFTFLWNDEDREQLMHDFPYGPIKNGKSWLEDICGVFVIDADETVLIAWSIGEFVKDVEEVGDDLMKDGMMYLLKRFLSKHYETIPAIESIRCSRWYSNSNFRGTYTYKSLDYENNNVHSNDLSDPLYDENAKPHVQFAGEATHPYYYSTVHGAVETGFREANRIINYYNTI